jgi:hypothetical protein
MTFAAPWLIDGIRWRSFCFEISTPQRNYFIHAANKKEKEDWISALGTLVAVTTRAHASIIAAAGTGLKFKSPDKMVMRLLVGSEPRC